MVKDDEEVADICATLCMVRPLAAQKGNAQAEYAS
jgi:hypothetical protein